MRRFKVVLKRTKFSGFNNQGNAYYCDDNPGVKNWCWAYSYVNRDGPIKNMHPITFGRIYCEDVILASGHCCSNVCCVTNAVLKSGSVKDAPMCLNCMATILRRGIYGGYKLSESYNDIYKRAILEFNSQKKGTVVFVEHKRLGHFVVINGLVLTGSANYVLVNFGVNNSYHVFRFDNLPNEFKVGGVAYKTLNFFMCK